MILKILSITDSRKLGIILLSSLGVVAMSALVVFDARIVLLLLGGILGATFYVGLSFKKPFSAFMLMVLFALNESLSGIQVMGGISFMIAVGFVFVFVWVARLATHGVTFIAVKEYWPLMGLGIIVIISSIANWGGPAGFRPVLTYLQQLLLVLLMVNFVTSPERLRSLGTVIIISSSLIALPMLTAQFGWVSAYAIGIGIANDDLTMAPRMMGYFGDPNFTSAQLVLALPFIVEWWPGIRIWRQRALLLAVGGMILLAFFYTFSIVGLVGLLTYLLLKVMFLTPRNLLVRVGRLVLGIILGFFIFFALFPDAYQAKMQMNVGLLVDYINTGNSASFSEIGTGRGNAWQGAFRAIEASPLLGYGPGNGAFANARYVLTPRDTSSAHNMLLSVASDLGLFGLVFFAYLFVAPWLGVMPHRGQQKSPYPLLQASNNAVFAAITICLVIGLGINLNSIKFPWVLIGMAIVSKQLPNSSAKINGDE